MRNMSICSKCPRFSVSPESQWDDTPLYNCKYDTWRRPAYSFIRFTVPCSCDFILEQTLIPYVEDPNDPR